MTSSVGRTRYTGYKMAADTTHKLTNYSVGAFLPKTNGTITITDLDGTVVVDAVPVTAGVFVDIPLMLQTPGGTVTLAGGASGTLFV